MWSCIRYYRMFFPHIHIVQIYMYVCSSKADLTFVFQPWGLQSSSNGCLLPRVVEEFMKNHCWMGLVGDWNIPAEVDVMIRASAARNQASILGCTKGNNHIPKSFFVCNFRFEISFGLHSSHKCWQVSVDKIAVVGWVDLTKIGVLTQKDINKAGQWCEKIIAKSPLSCLVVF